MQWVTRRTAGTPLVRCGCFTVVSAGRPRCVSHILTPAVVGAKHLHSLLLEEGVLGRNRQQLAKSSRPELEGVIFIV